MRGFDPLLHFAGGLSKLFQLLPSEPWWLGGLLVVLLATGLLLGGWTLWNLSAVAAVRRRFLRLEMGLWGLLLIALLLAFAGGGLLSAGSPPPQRHLLLALSRFSGLLALAMLLAWASKIKHLRYSLRWLNERLHLQDFTPADQSLFSYLCVLGLVGISVIWSLPPSFSFLWPWGVRLLVLLLVWLVVLLLSRQPLLRKTFQAVERSWTRMEWSLEERLWFAGISWCLLLLLFLRWLLPSEMSGLVQAGLRLCTAGLLLVFAWSLTRRWLLPALSRGWSSFQDASGWSEQTQGPVHALLWWIGLSALLQLVTPALFSQVSLLLSLVGLGLVLLLLATVWQQLDFAKEEHNRWRERLSSLQWSASDRSFWVAMGAVALSSLLALTTLPPPWPAFALVLLRVEVVVTAFWLWTFAQKQNAFQEWSSHAGKSLEGWGWRKQDSRWFRIWLGSTGVVAIFSFSFSPLATGLWVFWAGITCALTLLLGGALLWRQGWIREQLDRLWEWQRTTQQQRDESLRSLDQSREALLQSKLALHQNQQELQKNQIQLDLHLEQLSEAQGELERCRTRMEEDRTQWSEWQARFEEVRAQTLEERDSFEEGRGQLEKSVQELERSRQTLLEQQQHMVSQSERHEQSLLQSLEVMERQLQGVQEQWATSLAQEQAGFDRRLERQQTHQLAQMNQLLQEHRSHQDHSLTERMETLQQQLGEVTTEWSAALSQSDQVWDRRLQKHQEQTSKSLQELQALHGQTLTKTRLDLETTLELQQQQLSNHVVQAREDLFTQLREEIRGLREDLLTSVRLREEEQQGLDPAALLSGSGLKDILNDQLEQQKQRLAQQQRQLEQEERLWKQVLQWLEDTRADWQVRQESLQREQGSLRAAVQDAVEVFREIARWPDLLQLQCRRGWQWLSNAFNPWKDRAFSQWRDDRTFWEQSWGQWRDRLPLVELNEYEQRFVKTLASTATTLALLLVVLPNSASTLLLWGVRLELALIGLLLLFVLSRQTQVSALLEQLRSFVGLIELDEDRERTLFAMTWALLVLSGLTLAVPPTYQGTLLWMERLLLLLGAALLWRLLAQQAHVQTLQRTCQAWLQGCVWTPADRSLLRLLTWSGGLLLGCWCLLPLPGRSGWLWAFRINLALLWLWALQFAMREAHIQRWWLRFDPAVRRESAARGWRLWSTRAVFLWLGGTGVTFGLQLIPLFWVWQGLTLFAAGVALTVHFSSLQNMWLGLWMQKQGLLHKGEEIQQGSWKGRVVTLGTTFCELETEDGPRLQLPYSRLRQEGFVQLSRAAFRTVRLETRLDPGSYEPDALLSALHQWLAMQEGLFPEKQSTISLGAIDERGQLLESVLYLTPNGWRIQQRNFPAALMEELGRAGVRLGLPQQTVLLWNQED